MPRTVRQSGRQAQPRAAVNPPPRAGLYEVTNKAKGHTYHVRIERRGSHTFGTCTCEAGTPHKGRRVPVVCKHLAAVVIYLRAVSAMRRAAVH